MTGTKGGSSPEQSRGPQLSPARCAKGDVKRAQNALKTYCCFETLRTVTLCFANKIRSRLLVLSCNKVKQLLSIFIADGTYCMFKLMMTFGLVICPTQTHNYCTIRVTMTTGLNFLNVSNKWKLRFWLILVSHPQSSAITPTPQCVIMQRGKGAGNTLPK